MGRVREATISFALLLFIAGSSAELVDLDMDNFDEKIKGSRLAIVEFYAPWCTACKNFASEYEKVVEEFDHRPDVLVARVDGFRYPHLSTRYQLRFFPTMKIFVDGSTKAEDCKTSRKSENIIRDLQSRIDNVAPLEKRELVLELTSDNFTRVALNKNMNVLVTFVDKNCPACNELLAEMKIVAQDFAPEGNFAVAKMTLAKGRTLAKIYGVKSVPYVRYFPRGDKRGAEYIGILDADEIGKYVNSKEDMFTFWSESRQMGRNDDIDEIIISHIDQIEDRDVMEVKQELFNLQSELSDKEEIKCAQYYIDVLDWIKSEGFYIILEEMNRVEDEMAALAHDDKFNMTNLMKRFNVLQLFYSSAKGYEESDHEHPHGIMHDEL